MVSAGGKPENLARSARLVCWRQRVLDGPVQPAEAETVGEGAQSESRALPLVSVARAGEDDDRAAQISASHGSEESNCGWAGHLFGDHSLQLNADLIDQLPTILRIYVGCAEQLYGSIGTVSADLIKIHMQSSKLTLLRYRDFANSPLPRLIERIKIDMARTLVEHFEYQDPDARPCLVSKSRFMSPAQSDYDDQCSLDEELGKLLPRSENGFDAPADTVKAALAASTIDLPDI